jgi:hypothetical protein
VLRLGVGLAELVEPDCESVLPAAGLVADAGFGFVWPKIPASTNSTTSTANVAKNALLNVRTYLLPYAVIVSL